MRDLISSEIQQISGGEGWSDYQLVAATATSTAVATLFTEFVNKTSYTGILKSVILVPILPTLLSAAAVYAVNSYNSFISE